MNSITRAALAVICLFVLLFSTLPAQGAVQCNNIYEPCETERQPPPPPSSISYPTQVNSGSSYTVSWTGMAAATSYILEEKIGTGNWTLLENSLITSKTFSGKSAGTYQYRVRTCANSLLFEGCSIGYRTGDVLTVLSSPLTPPAQITYPGTNATFPVEDGAGTYQIRWTEVASAGSYLLEERVGSGGWVKIAQPNTNLYNVAGKQSGEYSYRVKACADTAATVGCSESFRTGGVVSVKLGPVAPEIEQLLDSAFSWALIYGDVSFLVPTFNPAVPGSVVLTWTAINGATNYQYRVWNEQTQTWSDWISIGAQQYLNYYAENQAIARLQFRSCNGADCGVAATETVYLTFGSAEVSRIKAAAWLIKNQHWDGRWSAAEGVEVPVTAAALQALRRSGIHGYAALAGMAWLDNANASSVDAQARRISALSGNNLDVKRHLAVIQGQVDNASVWGTYAKFSFSSLDTALSIIALRDAEVLGQNYVPALCAIARSQSAIDKGWGYSSRAFGQNGKQIASNVVPSAHVAKALYRLMDMAPTFSCGDQVYDTKAIADGALNTFLLGRKKPDGSFGDSDNGSIFETALVYELLRDRLPGAPVTKAALSNLLSKQQQSGIDAGSWMGDAFLTAVVLGSLEPLAVAMPDADADGVPDAVETQLGTNPMTFDSRYLAGREERTVDALLSIDTLPSGVTGVPYTHSLPIPKAATAPVWRLIGGQLPDGLSISPTGTVSGTPTRATDATRFLYQITGTPQTYIRMAEISVSLRSSGSDPVAKVPGTETTNAIGSVSHHWPPPSAMSVSGDVRNNPDVHDIYIVAGPSQWDAVVHAMESIFNQKTVQKYLSAEINAADVVWLGQTVTVDGERNDDWLRVHLKKVNGPELRHSAVIGRSLIEFLQVGKGCRLLGSASICDQRFEKKSPQLAFIEGEAPIKPVTDNEAISYINLPAVPFAFATTKSGVTGITTMELNKLFSTGDICVESAVIARAVSQSAGLCAPVRETPIEEPERCIETRLRTDGFAHALLPVTSRAPVDASWHWVPVHGLTPATNGWRVPVNLVWRSPVVGARGNGHSDVYLTKFVEELRIRMFQHSGADVGVEADVLAGQCQN